MDNCIGKRNYRYFFFFVFSLSIHIISVFIFSLMFVLEKKGDLTEVAVPYPFSWKQSIERNNSLDLGVQGKGF